MGKAVQPIKNEDLELDLLEYLMANDERMYMFYLILRYTGFRASDVLPIKVRDIQGNRLIIREKKTENRANKEERKISIDSVGIKDFGTHSGRKTCAYHIYMNTGSLDDVKNFLMHENARDTIRYVGIDQEVRDNTINKISSPLALIRKRKYKK